MTRITLRRRPGGFDLRAAGHAAGSSQVCAAVSALLYALGGYLRNDPGAALRTLRLDSGDARIDADCGPDGLAAMECTALGLLQIAAQYPDYLTVEVRTGEEGGAP